jgi:hypothetical protein
MYSISEWDRKLSQPFKQKRTSPPNSTLDSCCDLQQVLSRECNFHGLSTTLQGIKSSENNANNNNNLKQQRKNLNKIETQVPPTCLMSQPQLTGTVCSRITHTAPRIPLAYLRTSLFKLQDLALLFCFLSTA